MSDDEHVMMSDIWTWKDANKSFAVRASAQAKKPADMIPVENDVQCPQSTHSLGPDTISNLTVGLFWITAQLILMSTWLNDC